MLGYYNGLEYKEFLGRDCVNDFMQYLIKSREMITYRELKKNHGQKELKIYAHYGCRFDFLFILDWLNKNNLLDKIEMIVANGDIIKIKLPYNISFLDTGRLMPPSLKVLTYSFDVEHKKLDVDRENMGDVPLNIKRKYLKNDVLGLYEVLAKFWDEIVDTINIEPKLTLASTAMYGFRKYLKDNTDIFLNSITRYDLDMQIRNSFYGGRVEIFNTYGENIYAYDMNSMYPYVMCKYDMPIGKYIKITNNEWDKEGYLGYGKFKVKCPSLYLPVLPYRADKLYFPIGQWIGWYSFTEAKLAIENGYEMEFIEGYYSRASSNLFKDYITKLYVNKQNAKEDGNEGRAFINKILMNSFFGKFGERWDKTTIHLNLDKIDIGKTCVEILFEEPPMYLVHSVVKRPHFNVGIASEVTTGARIETFNIMQLIRKKGYKVYYTDTDCVHTDMPPSEWKNLLHKSKLGAWDNEYGLIKEALYLAPKFYFLKLENGEVIKKHKGFKNIGLPFEEIKEMYFDDNLKIFTEQNSICKLLESIIAKNDTDKRKLNRKSLFLASKTYTKEFNATYNKRVVFGTETKPLIINNLSYYNQLEDKLEDYSKEKDLCINTGLEVF